MKHRCEVCEAEATHACAGLDVPGLDVPALEFCEEHAAWHKANCPHAQTGHAEVVRMGGEEAT